MFKQFAQHALTSVPCFRIGGHFPPFRVLGFGVIFGKISAQPHTTLCIQFLDRENNDKNNTLPLGKQICFTIVWGCFTSFSAIPPFGRSGFYGCPRLGSNISEYSLRYSLNYTRVSMPFVSDIFLPS